MLEMLKNAIAEAAFSAAVQSADEASYSGMFQMEEPAALKELASEDASDTLMEELKACIASETDLNLLKKMTRLVIEATSAEEFRRNISSL